MKKKIFSLVLAMTLVLAYAVPVAATEEVVPETVPAAATEADAVAPNEKSMEVTAVVSEDPAVQAVYDAYNEVAGAYAANEYGPLKDAFEQYNSLVEDLSDEQYEEWQRVINEVIGYEEALDTVICAAMVIGTVDKKEAYKDNPNAKTAREFVELYEECVAAEIEIALFDYDLESTYEQAKNTDMPTDAACKIADAYEEFLDVMNQCDIDILEEALDKFAAIIENTELTPEECEMVAELLGIQSDDPDLSDGEYVTNLIVIDVWEASVLLTFDIYYSDYQNNKNEETAKAYVEYCESYLFVDEEDQQINLGRLYAFFPDAHDVYEDALAYLDSLEETETAPTDDTTGSEPPVEEPQTETDESVSDNTPATGDDFNVVPYAVLMLMAAAVAGLTFKRRKVQ